MVSSKEFKPSSSLLHAGTTVAATVVGKNPQGETVVITDTQGLNDSEGRDEVHYRQMIDQIKAHGVVHAFILVFNGAVPRWNCAALQALKYLAEVFPRFWENLIVVINFMS